MNDWPCLAIVKNQYPNGIFDFIGGAGAVCVIMIVKTLSMIILMPLSLPEYFHGWEGIRWLFYVHTYLNLICFHGMICFAFGESKNMSLF